ncbi:hypothetical protein BLL52_0454 [Rhodoferax antarcticus ANT.BR]|uniref:Uncharacterized protein n=1 Tax=Rhodoferax antarcticus ANT.BR TaxID=1111071 RepID=A0A1Q8YJF2_9BURK|nr:hypothetical protein BLL52_0454 [Rhodoferax antarcticus ANT.BR]
MLLGDEWVKNLKKMARKMLVVLVVVVVGLCTAIVRVGLHG